jgi:hypothetical protein
MTQDTHESSYRERLLEHLLISELLKLSWQRGDCSLEISQPEVDRSGYDLIAEAPGVLRHIQLKTTAVGARTKGYTISLALGSKPSGCIVVVLFEKDSLKLGPFLFFGDAPGKPLPSLTDFKVAKNVRANAQGKKAERKNHRVVPHRKFSSVDSVEQLYETLFGAQQSHARDVRNARA